MKDGIGQEIVVGDTVVVCGGRYADAKLQEVIKITAKRVQVPSDKWQLAGSFLDPNTVVVVTGNLAVLRGEWITVSKKAQDYLVDCQFKLQCLEGAGIDNCEAYAFGMEEYFENGGGE